MPRLRTLSPLLVRQLAVLKQRLAGSRPAPDADGIMEVVRDIGCLQLDPVNVLARSHELVLWSRLGSYPLSDLDRLRWEERRLFDYWAHAASIVPTEDYPIHQLMMRTYPSGRTIYSRRAAEWMDQNRALRRHVLSTLRRRGPLRLRDLEDRSVVGWRSSGWTSDRNVSQMLHFLWFQGRVVVAGRSDQDRWWDLAERWFPAWTPRERLAEREVVRRAAQRSLRSLGVGTLKHIERHFTSGRYPRLAETLDRLHHEGQIEPVSIEQDGASWPGQWFLHKEDLALVERLEAGEWEPHTTLLSPFDNLIIDRARVERMFGFRYKLEIYVPKAKRTYGPYTMPILCGHRFVGRVDAAMDRKRGRLVVKAMHAESDVPSGKKMDRAVAGAVQDLATFLGAVEVEATGPAPEGWRRALG